MRYVLWNNKGGVGKTLLSFLLSTEYAIKYPHKPVVVIDMCPQSNISQMLLGGTTEDKGTEAVINFMRYNKTIMGYFIERATKYHFQKSQNSTSFLLSPDEIKSYNPEIPSNLHLISGDISLDMISESIDALASMKQLSAEVDPKKATYSWLIDLQEAIVAKLGNETVFFIDTNPSFSSYTKMALLSADRIITPCFADVGSYHAINHIMYLLYGISKDHSDLKFTSLKHLAKEASLIAPLLYMVIVGKSTIYNKESAIAFSKIEIDIENKIQSLKERYNGQLFHASSFDIVQKLQDLNSIAPFLNITGKPLSKILPTNKTGIKINGREMQIGKTVLKNYQDRMKEMIELL